MHLLDGARERQMGTRRHLDHVSWLRNRGHLDFLEKPHLVVVDGPDLLGRGILGAERWETAFTADPAKAGIQPVQIRLILDMAAQQLKAGGPGFVLPGLNAPKSPSGNAPGK